MFRDLKEYQEIAKLYAEKVSKTKDLDENRNTRGQELAAKRLAEKPKTREEVGLKPKVTSFADRRAARTGYQKPEKKLPTTDEIRAKNAASGGTGMSNIPKKEGNAVISGKKLNPNFGKKVDIKKEFPDKIEKPQVSTTTKQGQPRTKAQMMAAKRIADGKSIADVKAANTASMRAKAAEKNQKFQDAKKSGNLAQFRKDNPKMSGKEKAQAMAKARLAAKNKPVAGGSAPKAKPTGGTESANVPKSGVPTRKVTSSTTQSGNTTSTRTKVTSGTGGGTAGLTSSAGSLEANKKKAARLQAIADKNAAMENYTPYDIVLEYLLSSEQVATIEEANYVMTEMDAETIQAIVKEGSMDVPPDVKAAAKRQYKAGSPGAEPYTVDDKKTIINYYKNKKGKV